MTDVSAAETPIELEPSIPHGLEATVELDAMPPQAAAVDGLAPATDQDDRSASVDAVAAPSAEAPAERALPFADVDHLGVLRRAVLDALVDADEPLSVARIIAEMPPGTTRGSAESAIKREYDAGRLERVAPGVYRLAPAKPLDQPKPAPLPEPDKSEDEWFAAFESWVIDPESWDREVLGPRPNEPGRRIPADIVTRGVDRSRKRQARQRDREAAQARQAVADAELRAKLLAATGGNYTPGPGLDDLAPIKLALQVVSIDRVVSSIRNKTDRKLYPKNEPASSWRARPLLKAIAQDYCDSEIVPSLVAAWEAAGKAPATKAEASLPPADLMTEIDRSRHDQEHAPAGPHVMPDVAPAPADAPGEPASASEAPPAVSAPVTEENAPVSSPPQPMPEDRPAIDAEHAAVDAEPRAQPTRASVLAAFNRNRTTPQPATPQPPRPAPPQPRPAERPWFAGPEVPHPESEMTDDGWRFVLEGFVVGSVAWAKKHGPGPGTEGCRVPRRILKEFGF
jgi:hypothetical protein